MAESRRTRRPSTFPDPSPGRAETRRKVMVWVMVGILLFSILVVLAESLAQG